MKPWLLDTIYVIKSGDFYRAQPPSKVVNNRQTVKWDGRGKPLTLTPQSELSDITQVAPDVVTATINTTAPFFAYRLICDNQVVEGNSPPIIIVE